MNSTVVILLSLLSFTSLVTSPALCMDSAGEDGSPSLHAKPILPAELDLDSLVDTYDHLRELGNDAPEEELITFIAASSGHTLDRAQQDNAMAYVLKNSKTSKKFEDRLLKTVSLKTLAGRSMIVQAFLDETVSDLKALMQEREGIPPDQQRLIFAGKQMDDERLLSEYNIRDEAIVNMILRLRAPGDGEALVEPIRTFSQEERPYVAFSRAHDYMARFVALLGSHYDPDLLRRNEEFSRFLVTSGIRQSVEESGIEGALELLENFFALQAHFSPALNPSFTTLPHKDLDQRFNCLVPTLNSLFPKSYRIPLAVKYFSIPAREEGMVRPFSLLGEYYDPALFGHAETLTSLVKADHMMSPGIGRREGVERAEEILTQIVAAYVHASPILNPHFSALPEEIRLALTPGTLKTMAAFFNMNPGEAIKRLEALVQLDQLEADIQARMGDSYDPKLTVPTHSHYPYVYEEALKARVLDKIGRVHANLEKALKLPSPPKDLYKQMDLLKTKLGLYIDSYQPRHQPAQKTAQETALVYLGGAKAVLKDVPVSEVDRARAMVLYTELEAIMAAARTHAPDQSGGGPA